MKPIPLYDVTAPIACTAESNELATRIAQIERLRDSLAAVDRTEHGLLLHFPGTPELEAEVRRFAADEKRCCQFWGFEIVPSPDEVTLRWDGPPAVAEFLDRLQAFLLGDEPLTADTGLF